MIFRINEQLTDEPIEQIIYHDILKSYYDIIDSLTANVYSAQEEEVGIDADLLKKHIKLISQMIDEVQALTDNEKILEVGVREEESVNNKKRAKITTAMNAGNVPENIAFFNKSFGDGGDISAVGTAGQVLGGGESTL